MGTDGSVPLCLINLQNEFKVIPVCVTFPPFQFPLKKWMSLETGFKRLVSKESFYFSNHYFLI